MDTIKIKQTGEVAQTIKEITSLLDEYCRIVHEDLQMLKHSAQTVKTTAELVEKRRMELQEQMHSLRCQTDASRDDYNQWKICEMGIARCNSYFRVLEKSYQAFEQSEAIEQNMRTEMENTIQIHSVIQTKLISLLKQIEAAY